MNRDVTCRSTDGEFINSGLLSHDVTVSGAEHGDTLDDGSVASAVDTIASGDGSSAGRRRRLRIAVFASGSGSNFQAIVDAVRRGELDVEIGLLVCDKPQAKVVERAEAACIATFTFRPKEYPSREAYEAEIVRVLEAHEIDLIVLAGYMRLITSVLLDPYEGRIINIHPSLLPAFPGVDGIGDAFRYGVRVTGVTVHYVDGGMDTGPIIAQQPVLVDRNETLDTLAAKIHAIEHQLYPEVIRWFSEGRVRLVGRDVIFD